MAIGPIGAGQLPAGLVVSRFADIDGTGQVQPQGAVMMQNGTVTYDFRPTLAPGRQLTVATLDSTSLNQKGFPGQPGPGLTPNLHAEVWDWAKAAWVSVDYKSNGTTMLPSAAVDPSSGNIRLRINATGGQAMMGAISLTGTVE
jgi:hypothetical protein